MPSAIQHFIRHPIRSLQAVARSLSTTQFLSGSDLEGAPAGSIARPYEQSVWVQAAVTMKARELSEAPLKFYLGDEEFADPRLAAWWARGFVGAGGRRFGPGSAGQILSTWLDLEGEYFLVMGDDWLAPVIRTPWALGPLVIVRPARMRHILRGGQLIGWVMTDAAGMQHALLPEQVVHRPLFNPYDEWRGLAPTRAILNAADADHAAGVYVRNLMRNNGDQGVYVIAKGGVIDEPQREQIAATLRAKRAARMRGQFIPTFLTGDITVEDPKAQAPDANLQATRIASREEIFVGLGVPPSMAQVKATYSTGAASDRYQLITSTVKPLSRFIWEPVGELATRQTGQVLEAEADWDDHPVMQEVRVARVDTALKLAGVGMPMEKANAYLDLGLPAYAGWEIGYLPFSVSPVDASGLGSDPVADPALAEPVPAADDPAVAQLRLVLLARARSAQTKAAPVCREVGGRDPFADFVCACHGTEGYEIKERDPKQLARWRDLMAKRRETVRSYEARFGRELMTARREVLAKIERNYQPEAKTRAAAADLVFDLAKWRDGLLAAMRKVAATALNNAGKQLFAELGKDDPFAFPPEAVLEFARSRENKLSGVADEVHSRISSTLEEGIVAGDTTEELAKRIRSEFNAIAAGRARVIAMTETSAAYGQGRQQAMQEAGIEYKQWLTSGNSTVRAAHAAANDQIVPVDGYFDVGGEQLAHPGDPAGSPENVINCHCVSIPVETAEG